METEDSFDWGDEKEVIGYIQKTFAPDLIASIRDAFLFSVGTSEEPGNWMRKALADMEGHKIALKNYPSDIWLKQVEIRASKFFARQVKDQKRSASPSRLLRNIKPVRLGQYVAESGLTHLEVEKEYDRGPVLISFRTPVLECVDITGMYTNCTLGPFYVQIHTYPGTPRGSTVHVMGIEGGVAISGKGHGHIHPHVHLDNSVCLGSIVGGGGVASYLGRRINMGSVGYGIRVIMAFLHQCNPQDCYAPPYSFGAKRRIL